jgi:SAM-dependent methyltransferase
MPIYSYWAGIYNMDIIIALILLLLLSTVAIAGASFAPWVPARKADLGRIFKLADLKAGETFYDLGCGNGRVVIYAAKNFQAKAMGLEIAFPLYLICKWQQIFNPKVIFKYKNLFTEDLSKADVIYFFGTPKRIAAKLKIKLEKEVRSGARVISYVFPVEGWTPTQIDRPNNNVVPIYLYIR